MKKTCRSIMVQGTGSSVGKSLMVTALCRIFREEGFRVAPFKPQNMSLNSFVTATGCEVSRAQAVQAEAAGVELTADMNPILLKPLRDKGSQVIVHGRVYGVMDAKSFQGFKKVARGFVLESFRRLSEEHDIIVIEGAGSPAEINLREEDIANMGTAHMTDSPVILVGDIDRGGVFASIVGTLELLSVEDRDRIKGFVINKFRGDLSLLTSGLKMLEERTGLPVLGVVPFLEGVYIQEEDGVNIKERIREGNTVDIAVIQLPHISNFTDFEPFLHDEDVTLRYVKHGTSVGRADILIIPGTKNTIEDLRYLKRAGYLKEIQAHVERGGMLIGICGGFQMLGRLIEDPYGVEEGGTEEGLGYLPVETRLEPEKLTQRVEASLQTGNIVQDNLKITGYEIHAGTSRKIDDSLPSPFLIYRRGGKDVNIEDGCSTEDGRIWGTYIHGLFDNTGLRRALIERVKMEKGLPAGEFHSSTEYSAKREEGYRRLAEWVRKSLKMDVIYQMMGLDTSTRRIGAGR